MEKLTLLGTQNNVYREREKGKPAPIKILFYLLYNLYRKIPNFLIKLQNDFFWENPERFIKLL